MACIQLIGQHQLPLTRTNPMKIKALVICALAMAALAGSAFADEVTVAGSTKGGFNGNAVAATATTFGLTFTTGSFSVTTAGGAASIGGATNNLGSFSLTGAAHNYVGTTFELQVTFTLPAGVGGGSFTATISGIVVNSSTGGVTIDFDNSFHTFVFNNGTTHGSFKLRVNDVDVSPGESSRITGNIRDAISIPDGGSSVALLGLATIAIAALRRKFSSS